MEFSSEIIFCHLSYLIPNERHDATVLSVLSKSLQPFSDIVEALATGDFIKLNWPPRVFQSEFSPVPNK